MICDLDLPAGVMARSFADQQSLAEAMAAAVAGALGTAAATRGVATLVVSGGRTPVSFLESLSRQPLSWANVLVSLADERWVAPEDPCSNEGLLRRHLLQGPAADARLIGLYRPAETLEQAACRADRALAELSSIDVLVLGMGDDGHTASLFPDSPGLPEAMRQDCPRRCLPMVAPVEPCQRLSMTLSFLTGARLPLLLIQGQAKLLTLAQALVSDDRLEMPIRAFLHSPLEIYWCP